MSTGNEKTFAALIAERNDLASLARAEWAKAAEANRVVSDHTNRAKEYASRRDEIGEEIIRRLEAMKTRVRNCADRNLVLE